ncbi:MAG: YdcF family protein [Thermodesulfobacteriota bacterium]|nr:YdcF family protein [Thermodesulfobacteriota bacterium]
MKIRNPKILFSAFSFCIILIVLLLGFSELPWIISRPFIYEENIQASPVIVVLYSGYGITERNHLDKYSLHRIQKAIQIWKKELSPNILFSGGCADKRGTGLPGSNRMAAEALRLGIPEQRILIESGSKDTYNNVHNTSLMIKKKGWDSLILVTHDFHIKRAADLFHKNRFKIYPAPVEWETKKSWKSNWTYLRFLRYELQARLAYLLLNEKQLNSLMNFLRPE